MEDVNILIIGAGAVGLSIGRILAADYSDVVVVERENTFGRHTSSRNSEVIHSGIYYPGSSLKARLCIQGNELLYQYCKNNGIPFSNCGKIVVATTLEELPALYNLQKNGEQNGVKGLRLIERDEIHQLEPDIIGFKALFVPSTGILDTHTLMKTMAAEIESLDGFIIYEMEATAICKEVNRYRVSFSNGEEYRTRILINCAGLSCAEISASLGINPAENRLAIHLCKGEYYKSSKLKGFEHLVYPLPDPKGISLGIHLSINLNGDVRFGPNAYYVDKIDYKMDETYKLDFLRAINRYLPITEEQLQLDDCGIRPKLQAPDEKFRDFYIREESERGFPGFINLIGIESPGLTSCLAIAEEIKLILDQIGANK
ncbi:MAG: NAD(P)/FAD-dependent oxidoreductase [Candidatus Cloacimonetes bacterium]|nr:NAD(P)/FAD-dependent oxidoreductase [Candidatus Cloacimonadota bacterium]